MFPVQFLWYICFFYSLIDTQFWGQIPIEIWGRRKKIRCLLLNIHKKRESNTERLFYGLILNFYCLKRQQCTQTAAFRGNLIMLNQAKNPFSALCSSKSIFWAVCRHWSHIYTHTDIFVIGQAIHQPCSDFSTKTLTWSPTFLKLSSAATSWT